MSPEIEQITQKLEGLLVHILANVNEWLRFAEMKNGALLAFSGACALGLLNFVSTSTTLSPASRVGIGVAIFCLWLSSLISGLSFLPRLSRVENRIWPEVGECSDDDNFLY